MYKDKEKQKQANKEIQKRRRKGVTKGVTLEGVTDKGVTYSIEAEHPVMKYLIPGENREKMEAVVESLKNHHVLGQVLYGIGINSIDMPYVGELLEVTR